MGLRLILRLDFEVDLEPERAALFGGALDANRAALQLHELLGDGKTKAGSAKPVDDRLIGLGEAIEDTPLGVGTDADAGVGDLEPQPYAVGIACHGIDRDVRHSRAR